MHRMLFLAAVMALMVPVGLAAAEPPTLAEDALAMTGGKKQQWRSTTLNVQTAAGTRDDCILMMEFEPIDVARPDDERHARVKLSVVHKSEGPPKSEGITSTGGFRDVRLREGDKIRFITITRAIETLDRVTKNTKRNLDRSSITFSYEISGDTLLLKGFPEGETRWGQLGFITPEREVKFMLVK